MGNKFVLEVVSIFLVLCLMFKGSGGKSKFGADLPNIALHKRASSSSQWGDHVPGKGIDGHENQYTRKGKLKDQQCTWSTSHYYDRTPWLVVDFGGDYWVKRIMILHLDTGGRPYYGTPGNVVAEVFPSKPLKRYPMEKGKVCFKRGGKLPLVFKKNCKSLVHGKYLRLTKFKTVNEHDPFSVCEFIVNGSPYIKKPTDTKATTQNVIKSMSISSKATRKTSTKRSKTDGKPKTGNNPKEFSTRHESPYNPSTRIESESTKPPNDRALGTDGKSTKLTKTQSLRVGNSENGTSITRQAGMFKCAGRSDDSGSSCRCLCRLSTNMFPPQYQHVVRRLQQHCHPQTDDGSDDSLISHMG